MTTPALAIFLDQVGFGYGREAIFEGFSANFQNVRITALLGPSGVGKSSLLNLIAGTVVPNSGTINFCENGQRVDRPSIGLVFQAPTLIPWRTVLSNILFGVEINHRERKQAATKHARALLSKFGLSGTEDRHPFELSGGMQQKVSIARALVSGAKILLLDEPFSNSDFVSRRTLQQEISRAVDTEQLIAVLVTHDLNDALRMGDRIVVVRERPVRILDSFDITIPREERLRDEASAAISLKPYFDRVWKSLNDADSGAPTDA
jgi:NitT/TauT family transport system ATP-binding protein